MAYSKKKKKRKKLTGLFLAPGIGVLDCLRFHAMHFLRLFSSFLLEILFCHKFNLKATRTHHLSKFFFFLAQF